MKLWRSVLLVLIALPAVALAQARDDGRNWNQSYDPYNAAVGLGAGFSSGSGLSIRWPALPQTMMSVTGGVWGRGDDLDWNVGAEMHLVLRQSGDLRFLAGPAVAVYSDDDDGEANVNSSLGFGLEYLLRPRVAMKFDVGFTYLSDGEKLYPLPQLSIFFYF